MRFVIWLVSLAISIGIGIAIANWKNRPVWQGVVAGIFGIIGWIVLAVLPKRDGATTAAAV